MKSVPLSNKEVAIVVFAYDFPHKKTQDFLFHLKVKGYHVRLVLGAPKRKLNIPPSSIRSKIRHQGLLHPADIADAFGYCYKVINHNDRRVPLLLREYQVELGIIAGARILKSHVIQSVPQGIINFHPGLIPEARGLDAVLWSILEDVPLGVTAHCIDERVDAGSILLKRTIPIYPDDTLLDLTERVYEFQLEMLDEAIALAIAGKGELVQYAGPYHRKMPPELEKQVLEKVSDYVARYAAEGA